ALELVAKTVVDHRTQPVARDLVMALHNNFSPACEEAMAAILRGGTEELRVSALDHLMDIGRKSAIAAAVEILPKERSGEVRRRCFRLLSTLTQQDFGESESNWVGWWEANKNKTWEEFTAGKEVGTTTLGNSRQDDYDRLRESKVLIVRAGEGCKCKKNHDLDQGINAMTAQHVWTTESITKDKFEHDPTVTDDWLRQFIAIIAICTHIREHCACPTCKLGAAAGMRLFQ
ncbi:MAG: hypothetical protein HYY16_04250, partial [Planctomycetes bacterium]|nr:hypothetical protein [Planctomycetota bacterium]